MNYQQAAQTALDCQDACNLSGVVKSLAGPVMDALWAEARANGHGTDWINQHPIVTLMLDKLASLNRSQGDLTAFSKAHNAVEKIIAEANPAKAERTDAYAHEACHCPPETPTDGYFCSSCGKSASR